MPRNNYNKIKGSINYVVHEQHQEVHIIHDIKLTAPVALIALSEIRNPTKFKEIDDYEIIFIKK